MALHRITTSHLIQKFRDHHGRGGRKVKEPEVVEVFREIVYSRHNSNAGHTNSEKPRLYIEDLHGIKPAKILAWMVEELMKSHPYLGRLW